MKSNFPLQWHAVRGLSDDDFYSNIRVTALKYLFRLDDEDTRRIIQKREDREGFGLMRDILSSCPSPFTGNPMEPTTCVMHFSSIGKPCLYLNMDGDSLLVNTNIKMCLIDGFDFSLKVDYQFDYDGVAIPTFSPDDKYVFCSGIDGAVMAFETESGKYNLSTLPSEDFPIFENEEIQSQINISSKNLKLHLQVDLNKENLIVI